MECLPMEKIPEGDAWTYELKLDGYRMVAVKSGGKLTLRSRRGTDMTKRFEDVAVGLMGMPDETVIDGELVALDEQGKPNFNLLQNFRSSDSHIMFYAFDVMVHGGEDVMNRPISDPKIGERLALLLNRWASSFAAALQHSSGITFQSSSSVLYPSSEWTVPHTSLIQNVTIASQLSPATGHIHSGAATVSLASQCLHRLNLRRGSRRQRTRRQSNRNQHRRS
jgi:hypothetical protein